MLFLINAVVPEYSKIYSGKSDNFSQEWRLLEQQNRINQQQDSKITDNFTIMSMVSEWVWV